MMIRIVIVILILWEDMENRSYVLRKVKVREGGRDIDDIWSYFISFELFICRIFVIWEREIYILFKLLYFWIFLLIVKYNFYLI